MAVCFALLCLIVALVWWCRSESKVGKGFHRVTGVGVDKGLIETASQLIGV